MKYYQVFTVTGMGHFPLDMLRYDHCWPAYEREMYLINNHEDPRSRSITIARRVDTKNEMPTIERWDSFGWTVSQIQTNRI